MRNTPPLLTTGRFTVRSPFVLPEGRMTCEAVRTAKDLYNSGIDPFKTVYSPVRLVIDDYQNDVDAGVLFVSLSHEDGRLFLVPDTYIVSFPNTTAVEYHRLVLGVDLGLVYSDLDIENLIDHIQSETEEVLGILPIITRNIVPTKSFMSQQEHLALEHARTQLISKPRSLKSRNRQLIDQLNTANQRLQLMEQVLRERGVLDD